MPQRWMSGAVHVPIDTNIVRNAMGAVVGHVVHHMVGPNESADARFRRAGSGASAHFGVTYEGIVFQWVAIGDAAYHACQANYEGQVGVENESPSTDDPRTPEDELWAPLTPEQVRSNANIARWLHAEHAMALRVADAGDRRGVGYHSMCPGPCGGAHNWGQTGCPGPDPAAQREEIVRLALAGPQFPSLKGDEDMPEYIMPPGKKLEVWSKAGNTKRLIPPSEWKHLNDVARLFGGTLEPRRVEEDEWRSLIDVELLVDIGVKLGAIDLFAKD